MQMCSLSAGHEPRRLALHTSPLCSKVAHHTESHTYLPEFFSGALFVLTRGGLVLTVSPSNIMCSAFNLLLLVQDRLSQRSIRHNNAEVTKCSKVRSQD